MSKDAVRGTNLTAEERLALKPGDVIEYRFGKMLSRVKQTVARVQDNPVVVVLDDNNWIGIGDELVLASSQTLAFPNRAEFAPEDQAAALRLEHGDTGQPSARPAACKASGGQGSSLPVDPTGMRRAPDGADIAGVACSAAPSAPPASGRAGTPLKTKAGRKGKKRNEPKCDHGLWLKAVESVLDGMAAGMRRGDAIAKTAGLPEFAGLGVNQGTYAWWVCRLRKQGLVTRSFAGGKNLPQSARCWVRQSDLEKEKDEERRDLVQRCDTLAEDLQRERERAAKLQDELNQIGAGNDKETLRLVKECNDALEKTTAERNAALLLAESTDAARKEAVGQLDSLKEAYGKLNDQYVDATDQLRQSRATVAELQRTNGELAKTVARYRRSEERPPEEDRDAMVSTKDVLCDARNLLRRLAVSVVLLEIGTDQAGDLHGLLQAVKGMERTEEGGEG